MLQSGTAGEGKGSRHAHGGGSEGKAHGSPLAQAMRGPSKWGTDDLTAAATATPSLPATGSEGVWLGSSATLAMGMMQRG